MLISRHVVCVPVPGNPPPLPCTVQLVSDGVDPPWTFLAGPACGSSSCCSEAAWCLEGAWPWRAENGYSPCLWNSGCPQICALCKLGRAWRRQMASSQTGQTLLSGHVPLTLPGSHQSLLDVGYKLCLHENVRLSKREKSNKGGGGGGG